MVFGLLFNIVALKVWIWIRNYLIIPFLNNIEDDIFEKMKRYIRFFYTFKEKV